MVKNTAKKNTMPDWPAIPPANRAWIFSNLSVMPTQNAANKINNHAPERNVEKRRKTGPETHNMPHHSAIT